MASKSEKSIAVLDDGGIVGYIYSFVKKVIFLFSSIAD